jgi:hypothetical protein
MGKGKGGRGEAEGPVPGGVYVLIVSISGVLDIYGGPFTRC